MAWDFGTILPLAQTLHLWQFVQAVWFQQPNLILLRDYGMDACGYVTTLLLTFRFFLFQTA